MADLKGQIKSYANLILLSMPTKLGMCFDLVRIHNADFTEDHDYYFNILLY